MSIFKRKKKVEVSDDATPLQPQIPTFEWKAFNSDFIMLNCGTEEYICQKSALDKLETLIHRFFEPDETLHIYYRHKIFVGNRKWNHLNEKGAKQIIIEIEYPNMLYLGAGFDEVRAEHIEIEGFKEFEILKARLNYIPISECEYWYGIRSLDVVRNLHIVIPKDAYVVFNPLIPEKEKSEIITSIINDGIKYLVENPEIYEREFGQKGGKK